MSVALDHDEDQVHHPFLQHHFEDLGQQHEASTLGMWMFLATEILFFGGVLCAYWIYRTMYPQAWAIAGAAAEHALRRDQHHRSDHQLADDGARGVARATGQPPRHCRDAHRDALLRKRVSRRQDVRVPRHWTEGLFPGVRFTWHEFPEFAPKVQLFMVFYWGLTGLHALHMVIGVGLLLWMIWRAWRGHFGPEYYGPVEVMGLYWHFVDIVWIFLFPFLYLIPHFGVHHG